MQRFQMLEDEVQVGMDIVPADRADNDTATSDSINRQAASGRFEEARAALLVGAVSGTPDSFTAVLTLQDSADNSSFAAVSGKSVTITEADTLAGFTWLPGKYRQYQRLHLETQITGGTTPKVLSSALAILARPGRGPVS